MKLVLANGCFDILHHAHIAHLREARAMGDYLVVSLTLDNWVNKGPGRPIYTWEQRALLLRELRCVDEVIPTMTAVAAILRVRPQVFVKGIDYSQGAWWTEDVLTACKDVGAQLRFTMTEKFSATDTIRKAMADVDENSRSAAADK